MMMTVPIRPSLEMPKCVIVTLQLQLTDAGYESSTDLGRRAENGAE